MSTPTTHLPGGTWTLGDRPVTRFGYGAMQLAGPWVMGPPADRTEAVAVLHEAVASGITHVDTSDAYGPHVTNEIIREALHPYPDALLVATKVGATRDADGGWPTARRPDELRRQVHDNLRSLGVERLDLVNLRMGDAQGPRLEPLEDAFGTLVELQHEGLIHHVGLSNVTAEQVEQAQAIGPVVCVQNHYNLAHRADDPLIDALAREGIAYTPYFPLGGFSPLQSAALDTVARRLETTPFQVALAWLLARSPNLLLIPGTSSVAHLEENLQAAARVLGPVELRELDRIGGSPTDVDL